MDVLQFPLWTIFPQVPCVFYWYFMRDYLVTFGKFLFYFVGKKTKTNIFESFMGH